MPNYVELSDYFLPLYSNSTSRLSACYPLPICSRNRLQILHMLLWALIDSRPVPGCFSSHMHVRHA
jgi:hypothetical protein